MRLAYDDPYMRRERKRNRVSALGLPGAGEHDRRERYGRSVCAILRAIGVKKSKKESLWVERWPDKMLIDMLDKMAEIWEDTVTNPDGKPAHLERLNINLNPIDVIYTLQAEARLRKLVVDYARAERNEKSAAKDSRRLDVKDAIEERHLLFKVIREVWAARPKGEEYVPDALDKSVKQLIARHMADFSVG
jgi:hypothetical protein